MIETQQKFMTVKELAKTYPSFSESSLRYMIYNAKQNGFSICIRKLGKKLVINLREFEKWIDSHKV